MKEDLKNKAISLRKTEGLSYNEICKRLSVSKGSVSRWCRDIELSEGQLDKLKKTCRVNSILCGKRNKIRWDVLKSQVCNEYNPPIEDPKFCLGLGLYWGEGCKSYAIGISNSDPDIILNFIEWVKTYFQNDFEEFSLTIHHYRPTEDSDVQNYWLTKLNLPATTLRKSQFAVSKVSKRKRNTLKYGTAHLDCLGKSGWKIRCKIEKAISRCRAVVSSSVS